jgi:hypothetical protein
MTGRGEHGTQDIIRTQDRRTPATQGMLSLLNPLRKAGINPTAEMATGIEAQSHSGNQFGVAIINIFGSFCRWSYGIADPHCNAMPHTCTHK